MGRKEAALRLRDRGKQFCDFFDAWTGLEDQAANLRRNLFKEEKKLHFCEEEMANPHPDLLPPKVLQNKVTIYPVIAEK